MQLYNLQVEKCWKMRSVSLVQYALLIQCMCMFVDFAVWHKEVQLVYYILVPRYFLTVLWLVSLRWTYPYKKTLGISPQATLNILLFWSTPVLALKIGERDSHLSSEIDSAVLCDISLLLLGSLGNPVHMEQYPDNCSSSPAAWESLQLCSW